MGGTTTVTEYEYDIDGRIKKETTTVTVVEAPVGPPAPPYNPYSSGGHLSPWHPDAWNRVWC